MRILFTFIITVFLGGNCYPQVKVSNQSGQTGNRILTTGVPFLTFTPDARAGALGETGVATSPDISALFWNNAKLAFIDHQYGFSVSHTPWLSSITDDMFISYLAGYLKLGDAQALGVSMRYFNLGDFEINDDGGSFISSLNPYEVAIDATYSRKLSAKLGAGVSARYIRSNTARQFAAIEETGVGSTVAVDLGVFYHDAISLPNKELSFSTGVHISNIGPKIDYHNASPESYIPTNLRIGASLTYPLDHDNSLSFSMDLNKLMVPTPPVVQRDSASGELVIIKGKDPDRNVISGMFGSFSDAPDGLSEELKEVMISAGLEYWYRELLALRVGYFHESREKGNRQYFTMGLGIRYKILGLDASYLTPVTQNHPLAETLRFTALFNFN